MFAFIKHYPRGVYAGIALLCGSVLGCPLPVFGKTWQCRCGTVRAVTTGTGNDTAAAWSPDGTRLAFQTDRSGTLDIAVVELGSGRVTGIVESTGHACYPKWVPDGAFVYTFGQHSGTSVQAATAKDDCGYGLRMLKQGQTQILTQGYWRDYTPSVTSDGEMVYYASTRGDTDNSVSLWRQRLTPSVEPVPELVLSLGGSSGAVDPSLSPDGRLLLWAQQENARQNWRLCAGRVTNLVGRVFLTPDTMSAYAPCWSPDGALIAFTGFRQGDPGWGIYVLEPCSGTMSRLETGKGNSCNPAWSPDGKELVFENNRTGFYKLYRSSVSFFGEPVKTLATSEIVMDSVEAKLVLRFDDVSLIAADGKDVIGVRGQNGKVTFETPFGLDFGLDTFFVKVTFQVGPHNQDSYVVAAGKYAEHASAWQIFVHKSGYLWFNARDPAGRFIGAESDAPVAEGTVVTVLGIRDIGGVVRLYVDEILQSQRTEGATMHYGTIQQLSLMGAQEATGTSRKNRVFAFKCGRGYPDGVPKVLTRAPLFSKDKP